MMRSDERAEVFETEFLRDRDRHFRIVARRNNLLGIWAAKCLGLWGKRAEDYAISVVESEIVGRGDEAVIDKLKIDLWKCAVPISEGEIRGQLKAFDIKAQQEILDASTGSAETP